MFMEKSMDVYYFIWILILQWNYLFLVNLEILWYYRWWKKMSMYMSMSYRVYDSYQLIYRFTQLILLLRGQQISQPTTNMSREATPGSRQSNSGLFVLQYRQSNTPKLADVDFKRLSAGEGWA